MDPILIVFFRWLHITSAALAVGGVFFIRIVFPIGLRVLDEQPRHAMLLATRRVFKMVVHTCILLLLVSGTYNAVSNWPVYTKLGPAVGHSLFGIHALLALIAFSIALYVLAGKEPPVGHQKWMAINLAVLLLTIAAASTLKYAREHPPRTVIPVMPKNA